jgi:hypothetical protein
MISALMSLYGLEKLWVFMIILGPGAAAAGVCVWERGGGRGNAGSEAAVGVGGVGRREGRFLKANKAVTRIGFPFVTL